MKAQELRIGNFIIDDLRPDRGPVRVFRLTSGNSYSITYSWGKAFEETYENADYFKHIDINEDWLLKFGFEKINHIRDGIIYKREWLVLEGQISFFGTWRGGSIGKIGSIARLQNLYFALTGEELILQENETK
jgi:hypothetical protein